MRYPVPFFTIPLIFLSLITPVFASCAYSGSGDWNITETDDCTNTSEIIWLNGDLTIYGNLTFDNVTLRVNGSSDGQYGIYVNSGGLFNITGDTSYSNITSGEVAGANYIFYVKSGSTFEAHDSYISGAGWQNANYHRGIDIYTDNVIMENNIITSDYRGIYLYYSSNNIFTNNTISSSHMGVHITYSSNYNTFTNNSITTPSIGVYLDDLDTGEPINNTFTNNNISSSGFNSVRIYYSANNTFTSNNISTSSTDYALYFYEGTGNNLTNNTIYSNDGRAVYLEWSQNNTFANNTIYSLAAANYALYFDYTFNNTLINNNISGVGGSSFFFETYTTIVENNTMSSTSGHGIELYYNVINNTFANNNVSAYLYGTYLYVDIINNTFTNMNISSSNDVGIYNWNSDNTNTLINSTITSAESSNDFYFRGTGGLTAINCSFNKSKTDFFSGTTADLYVKWYLNVNVTDSESNPIQDANVTGYNVTNGFIFTDQTRVNGSIDGQTLEEYRENATDSYHQTNYTLNTTKSGYITNSTQINLTENMQVNITLEAKRTDGSPCTIGSQCSGGYCVHSICRSSSTYCGDTFCDTGETCSSCSADCGVCAVTTTTTTTTGPLAAIQITSKDGTVSITIPWIENTRCIDIPDIINEMCISVKDKKYTVIVRITKQNETGEKPSGMIYQYFDVYKHNIQDFNIEKVKFKFAVNKSWIGENNINESAVTLNRYTLDSSITGAFLGFVNSFVSPITGFSIAYEPWTKLDTRKISETETEIIYEAESPGLSVFAITGRVNFEPEEIPEGPEKISWEPLIFIIFVIMGLIIFLGRK